MSRAALSFELCWRAVSRWLWPLLATRRRAGRPRRRRPPHPPMPPRSSAAAISSRPPIARPATPRPAARRLRAVSDWRRRLRDVLRHQHHAGSQARHRQLECGRVLQGAARRRDTRHAAVSGNAVHVVPVDVARRHRRDLRVSDGAETRRAGEPGGRTAASRSTCASGMFVLEFACSCDTALPDASKGAVRRLDARTLSGQRARTLRRVPHAARRFSGQLDTRRTLQGAALGRVAAPDITPDGLAARGWTCGGSADLLRDWHRAARLGFRRNVSRWSC